MRSLLIVLSLTLVTPTLWAKGPCKEDKQKFCKDVEKGKGRIKRCLFKNWDQLSEECKTKKQDKYAKWKKRTDACGADIEKFCGSVEPGEGRIRKCIKQNKKQMSEACQAFFKEKRGQFKEKLAMCKDDIQKLCSNIEKGKGRTWKCLKENSDQLSETCKSQWPSLSRGKRHSKNI